MATKPFLSQIAVPVGTTTGDVYYPQTSLLMHFNGTNGSTTMTDNSKNNFTVTSVNGAAISTAQSKFGGASGLFDGTDDYLSIPSNAAFNFGTGDFTVEFWVYPTTTMPAFTKLVTGLDSTFTIETQSTDNKLWVTYFNSTILASTTALSNNVWTHFAAVRSSGILTLYVNGTSSGSTSSSYNFGSFLYIGGRPSSQYFTGYIDEFRVTKGIARYTGNFTPSTTQFLDSTGDANSSVVVNSTATGFAIGTGGINGAQLAKAWVNFNGTGTVAIRDSYNVSSITDNSTGNYTVNFSTAFSNANYCVNASVRNFSVIAASGGSITTTGVTVNTNNASMISEDTSYVFVSIFSN